jgi:hypothetical protein
MITTMGSSLIAEFLLMPWRLDYLKTLFVTASALIARDLFGVAGKLYSH